MADMSPEEARNFCEDDEDPTPLFAAYDDAKAAHEAAPPAAQLPPSPETLSRVLASGLYGHLRSGLMPDDSAAGSNTHLSVQA